MNSIIQISGDRCTGCGSCFNKCPKGAINMVRDEEGFLAPSIEEGKCVNCGLCLKACPVNDPVFANTPEPECYAVMAEEELRVKSSSGGVFTMLAEWILDQGGVVCGAAYSDDCYSIDHIIVSDREGLAKLRGSKYVQSNTGMVYKQIEKYLKDQVPVLFTGTPCQAAAMKKFLGRNYDNLYVVDIVCHGVPSRELYEKFVREKEAAYGSKAIRVSFRDKDIVGWNVSMAIDFADGQKHRKTREECSYLKAFLNIVSMRRSCGQCPFARLPRSGDLSIADYWGVRHHNKAYDDKKGTSLVTVNNEKGKKLLQALSARAVLCVKTPLEAAAKYNGNLTRSSVLHARRNHFFDLLNHRDYSFEQTVDYAMKSKFDVGYVGWWYGSNYGSVLTNFAMNRVLKKMGKSVLMLEPPTMGKELPAAKPDSRSRRLGKHFYDQSAPTLLTDYSRFNNHCETFLVASDQLWNWYSNQSFGPYYYFLDWVKNDRRKVAYSTSFGHDHVHYPEDMRLKVSYYLQRFDAISVREKSAVEVCRRDFNVDAVQAMDPVFLCDMDSYEQAIALSKVDLEDKPYVLGYILNPTHEKLEAIRRVAAERGIPYRIILDGQKTFAENKKLTEGDPNVMDPPEVADWLKYFKHAAHIVTDSFHGFCYSIIFKNDMTIFPNAKRGMARFNTLAELAGLEDRLCGSFDEMIGKQLWNQPVDFNGVADHMAPHIEFGRQWLKEALDCEKRAPAPMELHLKQTMLADEKIKQLEEENRRMQKESSQLKTGIKQLENALQAEKAENAKHIKQLENSMQTEKAESERQLAELTETNRKQAEQLRELRDLLGKLEQQVAEASQSWVDKTMRKLRGNEK